MIDLLVIEMLGLLLFSTIFIGFKYFKFLNSNISDKSNLLIFFVLSLIIPLEGYLIISKSLPLFIFYITILFFLTFVFVLTKDSLRRYQITELKKILNKEELKVISKNEDKRKNSKRLSILLFLSILSSIHFLSFLLLTTFLAFFSPKFVTSQVIFTIIFFLTFTFSNIYLWVCEHEIDKDSVSSSKDRKNLVISLIKIDINNNCKNFKPFIETDISKIKVVLEYNLTKKYPFYVFIKDFFLYLIKNIPLPIVGLLNRKNIFIMYAPTKFRIMYLLKINPTA